MSRGMFMVLLPAHLLFAVVAAFDGDWSKAIWIVTSAAWMSLFYDAARQASAARRLAAHLSRRRPNS